MAAAYATLVSALNIINNLHHHPRPPISLHIQQVESLTQKIHFLLEFLEGYNPHRGYSKEADPLESRIADAAYAAEYAIESHILDEECSIVSHIFDEEKNDGENMSYDGLYEALEKVIQDMASIEEEAKQIQGRVGLQHQLHIKSTPSSDSSGSSLIPLHTKSTPPSDSSGSSSIPLHTKSTPSDSSGSSSIPQQSIMVGADNAKFQMMDKLTSDCHDLQIIPIVGMGGSVILQWSLQKEYRRNTRTITGKEPFKFALTSGVRTKQDLRAWIVLTFVLNVSHENHYYY